MIWSRSEILAKGQNLDPCLTQIVERLKQLCFSLSQPQHDSTFGHGARIQFLGPSQHLERQSIFGPRSDYRSQPFDRLQVVIVDIGLRVEHQPERTLFPVEIRSQY